jgi:tetrahydromethanopterin S-methyltransferase subunit G
VAKSQQKNIVERLANAGEEALQRFGNTPGADRVMGTLGSLRERVDDLQKSVREIQRLEKRLTAIERRLNKLEGKGTAGRSRKTSAARKTSTAPAPPKPPS